MLVVEAVEEQNASRLRCKDSSEWLLHLTFDLEMMCPLCCANVLVMPLAGLWTEDFDTVGASEVDVLGKEEGFCIDLGKVFGAFEGVLKVFFVA